MPTMPARTVQSHAGALLALALIGCHRDLPGRGEPEEPSGSRPPVEATGEQEAADALEAARRRAIARQWPVLARVEAVQLTVRAEPDPSAPAVGWVRQGALLRFKGERRPGPRCRSGFVRVRPKGWLCAGKGLRWLTPEETEEAERRWMQGETATPEEPAPRDPAAKEAFLPARSDEPEQAALEQALPYAYYLVKEPMVPEYHRLPSRNEQRAAQAWALRYLQLQAEERPRKLQRFLAGELKGEPSRPAVVRRYLDRGFFVAATAIEVRARRRFVRTTGGSYVKLAQLERRRGSPFHGIDLREEGRSLPLAFALRAVRPLIRRERPDGTVRFVPDPEAEPIARQHLVEAWRGRVREGNDVYHRLHIGERERFARAWFLGVAERIDPPFALRDPHEPWVHVDLSEQTLVLYEGEEPVYATLVSTGLPEHATPTGTFEIQVKRITDTMADLGPEAGDDRYRIEDVPWTQYFDGSVALHGAFWHGRFGLQRSHGCVNLSPRDARRVFEHTWPPLPEGWHGVSMEHSGLRASRVVVTP